eukprot:6454928-Amphidinium_carterae.1
MGDLDFSFNSIEIGCEIVFQARRLSPRIRVGINLGRNYKITCSTAACSTTNEAASECIIVRRAHAPRSMQCGTVDQNEEGAYQHQVFLQFFQNY